MYVAPLPPGISVVIPVYNSQESLPLLLPRLEEVLRRTYEATPDPKLQSSEAIRVEPKR